jgi:glutamate-ammonia-ligase adenylyltransferase
MMSLMRESYHFQRAETMLAQANLGSHSLQSALTELMRYSPFTCQQMTHLVAMMERDNGLEPYFASDYQHLLNELDLTTTLPIFCQQLRIIRHQQMLRLVLREIAGLSHIEQTLRCWSDFADMAIQKSIEYATHQLAQKHGRPMAKDGMPAHLVTLAMGKLGGQELNFSSDIDLIFTFDHHGETNGEIRIGNQEFFIKVVQLFSQIMQQKSQDGIVFRVDLRLRPHGDSGSLVPSLASIETYYQEQGRDWERYAMVKARVAESSLPASLRKTVDAMIIPFVFRRYVDFSVIESLRGMKSLIEREIELNPRLDDIKRGKGGIREIEFVVQGAQIIRGGRIPPLRVQSTLTALAILKEHKLLERCDALKKSYLFFRQLENLLQVKGDLQTHTLPEEQASLAMIAALMRFDDVDAFLKRLEQYQRIVSQIFQSFLGKQPSFEDDKRVAYKQIENLWEGHIEMEMSMHLLESLSFDDAKRCYHLINDFRQTHRVRRLSQVSRMRLGKLMVMIISELSKLKNQAAVLLRLIHLLESIVGRGTYLALLTENPHAIQTLIYYFAESEFIAQLIVQYPFLLEALLETESPSFSLPSRNELNQILQNRVQFAENDEGKIEIIKQFKLESWLCVARAMIHKHVPVIRVGRFLADLAQAIVNQVVHIAVEQLVEKYPRIQRLAVSFAVLSYGKAGSRELNFDSDLDLVFVHNFPRNDETLAMRLSQRLIHMLTTRSQTGVLYAVDTRLRPSGSAGLLVSHWDAFAHYQQNQAWIWEHQALLKARVMYGTRHYRMRLLALKKTIIIQPKDEGQLAKSVKDMRDKVGYETEDKKDIKRSPGGLLDIEFLIQYLVLRANNIDMARYTHTISLMHQLYKHRIISHDQLVLLKSGWEKAHHQLQVQSIGLKRNIKSYPFKEITSIYQSFIGCSD